VGTFVTTPTVTAESATIHIRSTVTNESATEAKLSLRVRLTGPSGSAVLSGKAINSEQLLILAPGDTADMDAETTLPKPDRWDSTTRDVHRSRNAAARWQSCR